MEATIMGLYIGFRDATNGKSNGKGQSYGKGRDTTVSFSGLLQAPSGRSRTCSPGGSFPQQGDPNIDPQIL